MLMLIMDGDDVTAFGGQVNGDALFNTQRRLPVVASTVSANSMQAQLTKIRTDAAECLLLSSIATDKKSQMFATMAEHLNDLATELERTLAANSVNAASSAPDPRLAPSLAPGGGESLAEPAVSVRRDAEPERKPAEKPRRLWPWLVLVAAATGGSILWADLHADRLTERLPAGLHEYLADYLPFIADRPIDVLRNQATAKPAGAVVEQSEREALSDRLRALAARVDSLASEMEKLRAAQAQSARPGDRAAPAAEKPQSQAKPAAQEEKHPLLPEDITFTVSKPDEQPSGGAGGDSSVESGGRTVAAASDKDLRRARSCAHFRSFDVASGTYVTYDGRRRPCP